jgi:hypothetical protein
MTRDSRNLPNDLLRSAEEALPRARARVAGPVPEWALPHRGTFGRHLSRQGRTSVLSACAGFGVRAASAWTGVVFAQRNHAMHQVCRAPTQYTNGPVIQSRHSAIAFCAAHVLNSLGAPTASFTKKLTRHDRGKNRGRHCAKTRCNALFFAITSQSARDPGPSQRCGCTLIRSRRCGPHRAELCGSPAARNTSLP